MSAIAPLKNQTVKGVDDRAMELLINYSWPGNIRELANFVERMVVLSAGSTLTPADLPEKILDGVPREKWPPLPQQKPEGSVAEFIKQDTKKSFMTSIPPDGINLKKTVEDFEKEIILEALAKTNWVKNKAAGLLGLNRTTLVEKLKKMHIKQEDHT